MQRWRKRPARTAALTALGLLGVIAAASVPLFIFPAKNTPSRADAIVVPGGDPSRLTFGRKLAAEGFAPTLLISISKQTCPAQIPHVDVLCFRPHPATTQGEARYTAKMARDHRWKKVIVVSSTEQTTRARIRLKRCTDIDISYVPSSSPIALRPYRIAYEWGALAKALIWQRGC